MPSLKKLLRACGLMRPERPKDVTSFAKNMKESPHFHPRTGKRSLLTEPSGDALTSDQHLQLLYAYADRWVRWSARRSHSGVPISEEESLLADTVCQIQLKMAYWAGRAADELWDLEQQKVAKSSLCDDLLASKQRLEELPAWLQVTVQEPECASSCKDQTPNRSEKKC